MENFVTPGITDTQAGLKAFRRHVAHDLFGRQKVDRFVFDIEVLILARRAGYRIDKIDVQWHDKPGSTVRPFRDVPQALADLAGIFWRLRTGRYQK